MTTPQMTANSVEPEVEELYTKTGIDLRRMPLIMSSAELAPAIGSTTAELGNDRSRGLNPIPYFRLGSRVRYTRVSVARYLLANYREGQPS